MHNKIIEVVEKDLNLPEGSIISQNVLHNVCIGRFICYRFLHEEHKWSANHLARVFQRTRCNIFRGISVLRHQMEYDKDLRHTYSRIITKLEGITEVTPSTNMENT